MGLFQKALELIQILEKPFLSRNGFRKLLPRQLVRSREVQLEDSELNIYYFVILLSPSKDKMYSVLVVSHCVIF